MLIGITLGNCLSKKSIDPASFSSFEASLILNIPARVLRMLSATAGILRDWPISLARALIYVPADTVTSRRIDPFTPPTLTAMVMLMFLELLMMLKTLLGGKTLMEQEQAGQNTLLMETLLDLCLFTPTI